MFVLAFPTVTYYMSSSICVVTTSPLLVIRLSLVHFVAYRFLVMSLPVHHRGEETDLGTYRSLTRLPFVPRNTVDWGRRGQRLFVYIFSIVMLYYNDPIL